MCNDGLLVRLSLEQIQLALSHDLIPLLHGDVAFDSVRGGTIISTEEIFAFLARSLSPSLVLLAGIEEGVLSSWPNGQVIASLPSLEGEEGETNLIGSHSTDVTGGMKSKVKEARTILLHSSISSTVVVIFSGEHEGRVLSALEGDIVHGTWIRKEN